MQPKVYCSDKGEIHMDKKVYCKRTKAFYRIFAAAACSLLLAGCQAQKPDDYATNQGYSDNSTVSVQNTTGITKENIKVGVIHLSDPAEGSGYTNPFHIMDAFMIYNQIDPDGAAGTGEAVLVDGGSQAAA